MTHRKFFNALILAVFVLSVLSSIAFVVLEANHDCTGDDCPICLQICLCKDTLKALTLISLVLFSLLLQTHSLTSISASGFAFTRSDLISLKVKLSR